MNKNKFTSNKGFLLSAIGGAVGFGNVWMFPCKLKEYGGTFLIFYLLLAFSVGLVLLNLEFLLGKYLRTDVISLYRVNAPKIKIIGVLTMISPLIILTYYCAAGGMCIKYLCKNIISVFQCEKINLLLNFDGFYTIVFIVLIYWLSRLKVGNGIERFNCIAVPLLMLSIVTWAVILIFGKNFDDIIKEVFKNNNYSMKHCLKIFATASDQMFFSLSIAVGSMITYGSMMPDNQNTVKSSVSVVIADTLFALAMSVVVMSASINESFIGNGPQLIFDTMQRVFDNGGHRGNLLGTLFYFALIIAALTSAVSYVEVPIYAFTEVSTFKRKKILILCLFIVLIPAVYITVENFSAFYRKISLLGEGIIIPLTAFLSSLNFGVLKEKELIGEFLNKEIKSGFVRKIFSFVLKYIAECVIITVLLFQIIAFFK
ncbi:MAG: hypothetical protein E7565_08090 [Ruminococcaceae bacterium]|nr:hypothetical protein [Oscillospiraceae bacterium]